MWYINYHASVNISKVIEAVEEVKEKGTKVIAKELKESEYNNCLYIFVDGYEYEGKKLPHETVQELKAIHGKLKIYVIR